MATAKHPAPHLASGTAPTSAAGASAPGPAPRSDQGAAPSPTPSQATSPAKATAQSRSRPTLSPKRREQSRREFIRTSVLGVGVLGATLAGLIPLATQAQARLRPPGAIKDRLQEQEFLAACIKCGQCVQVCPVEAIHLADLIDGVGIGTPYIQARDQACDFSCDGLQCVLACPTGALTHDINYPAQARMGLARLSRPEACLAVLGQGFKGQARGPGFTGKLRYDEVDRWNPTQVADQPYDLALCDLCLRQCPIEIRLAQCAAGKPPSGDANQCPPRAAIRLEPQAKGGALPVVLDGCVGCGVCEMICPVEPAAIVIDIDRVTDVAPAV
ncbi:MAG: 4Fe-4S dicluster domain-containing protein [Gammaproteobacteria bacterium]|nr:4Fe-4S dicluster domain-containing protein [Gammaproteobacteria bacterium]